MFRIADEAPCLEDRGVVNLISDRSCLSSRKLSARCAAPSRPGEFHPEPLTDSGLDTLASSGSCHRTKAAAFR